MPMTAGSFTHCNKEQVLGQYLLLGTGVLPAEYWSTSCLVLAKDQYVCAGTLVDGIDGTNRSDRSDGTNRTD